MSDHIRDQFKEIVSLYGERVAVTYKKDSAWTDISYRELSGGVSALADLLSKENIRRQDKIGIFLKNRPEWPQIFLAAAFIDAVSIPINPFADQEEAVNILNVSETKILFLGNESLAMREQFLSRCPSLQKIISVDSEEFRQIRNTGSSETPAPGESRPDDLACILFTSGTTAEPKGAMLSHRNLISNCRSLYKLNLLSCKDSMFSILPLHHAYPLTDTMLVMLLCGGRIVYPGTLRGEELLGAMRKINPTIFVAVPQIYYVFHEKITTAIKKIPFPLKSLINILADIFYRLRRKSGINASRVLFFSLHRKFGNALRFFVSGGAKLDENVAGDLFKFGFTILEGYGLTETSPVATFTPLKKPRFGSVGLPFPDVEVQITDKDDKGMGEVIVRGPNVMIGYYKQEDLTRSVIKDGWFYTGDLGYFDKEGYLYLTGRKKDVIVLSSGLNIFPDEVEEAYQKDAPISEMCVFDLMTHRGGKETPVLWAVVVPDLEVFRKYGEVNLHHVIKERFDNVSRKIAPHKRLMGFTITLDPLPRTFLGKVKRFAVKEQYGPKVMKEEAVSKMKEMPPEDKELMENDFNKRIIEFLQKYTGADRAIVPADALETDLGIDSLGRVEIASGLEQLLGVKIPDEVIGNSFTVRDLLAGCMDAALAGEPAVGGPDKEKRAAFDEAYWERILGVPPNQENLAGIDLKPGVLSWVTGFIFAAVPWLFFKVFYRLKVEGQEHFPKKGPVIIYVNHTSYFDGFVTGVSFPGWPRMDVFFVGFRPYFNVPVIRNLIKVGRIIPLDFSTHLLESLRSCFYILKNGKCLCLFPEGLRTLDGKVAEFKKGFGILAKVTGVKLLPLFLEGTYQAWPRTSKFPRLHPIRAHFGEMLDPAEAERRGYELGARNSYEAICLGARDALIKTGAQDLNPGKDSPES